MSPGKGGEPGLRKQSGSRGNGPGPSRSVASVDDHETQTVLRRAVRRPRLSGRPRPFVRRRRWSAWLSIRLTSWLGGLDDGAVHAVRGLVGETDGWVGEAGGGEAFEVFLP